MPTRFPLQTALTLAACAALVPGLALAQHHGHGYPGAPYGHGAYGAPERTDAECRQDRRTAGTVGGLLGAGAGGAAGRALAATGVRPEGVVLGAVVGGFVGNRLGREAVYCPPVEYYTQPEGRSYGEISLGSREAAPVMAPGHADGYSYSAQGGVEPAYVPPAPVAPAYSQPVHAQPAYVPPTYAPPSYALPSYALPSYAPPAPMVQPYHQPAQVPVQAIATPGGWYAPSAASYYGRERGGPGAPVVSSWSSGYSQTSSYSYGPVLVPAPTTHGPAQAMPCGAVICR